MTTTFARALVRTTALATLFAGVAFSAQAQTAINGGGSSLVAPDLAGNPPVSPPSEFATFDSANPAYSFATHPYPPSGSGGGRKALQNDDCTFGGFLPACGGTPYTVHFGASDATTNSTELAAYAAGRGLTDGPLIQFPMLGVPITIPVKNTKFSKNGQVFFTDNDLCGVFSGKFTNWNQLSTGTKLAAGAITVDVRSDSSGTSFLFTEHLVNVCTTANSNFNPANFPSVSNPIGLPQSTFTGMFTTNTLPANFVASQGNGNVAASLKSQTSGISYLSPDYTEIAPHSPNNIYNLFVAGVKNAINGTVYTPTVANTITGLANPGSNSLNGTPPTGTNAANPLNWIPQLPTTKKGYPIVGYTDWEVVTCYSDPNVVAALSGTTGFINTHFTNAAYKSIQNTNGFVPVSNSKASAYVAAIQKTFLTSTSSLGINVAGTGDCASFTGR